MKVIFLDVDGVLNSINKLKEVYQITKKPHSGKNYPFDEKCLNNLKDIVEATNSKIVITSYWKNNPESLEILFDKLEEYNLSKSVIGITPNKAYRELEILEYLKNNPTITNYIIIDDDGHMGTLSEDLIKTDIQTGLTKKDIKKCIKKLNMTI